MTEQEIESLQQILNENEVQTIRINDELAQDDLAGTFVDLDLKSLKENDIQFLVRLSIVPKIEDGKVIFVFNDVVMKNEIIMRALPPVDIIVALNSHYPSHASPLFV
jgi:hypothetical protein